MGQLSITVTDANGKPVEGATVHTFVAAIYNPLNIWSLGPIIDEDKQTDANGQLIYKNTNDLALMSGGYGNVTAWKGVSNKASKALTFTPFGFNATVTLAIPPTTPSQAAGNLAQGVADFFWRNIWMLIAVVVGIGVALWLLSKFGMLNPLKKGFDKLTGAIKKAVSGKGANRV